MKLTDAVIKNINHQDKDQFFSMQGIEHRQGLRFGGTQELIKSKKK